MIPNRSINIETPRPSYLVLTVCFFTVFTVAIVANRAIAAGAESVPTTTNLFFANGYVPISNPCAAGDTGDLPGGLLPACSYQDGIIGPQGGAAGSIFFSIFPLRIDNTSLPGNVLGNINTDFLATGPIAFSGRLESTSLFIGPATVRLNEAGASVTLRLDWLLEDESLGSVVLSTGNITFDESHCPLRADCFIPKTEFFPEIPGGALENVIQHEGRLYFSLVGLSSYEEPPVSIDIAGKWAGVWTKRDKAQAGGALSAEFFQTDGHLSGGFRGLNFFIRGNPDARGTVDGTISDSGGVDFDVVFSAPEFTGEFQGSFAKNRGSGRYTLPFDRSNKTGGWRLFRQADSPASVVIDGCGTGVPNIFFDGQHTLSEKIEGCALGALTRRQFRSCVNLFVEGLKETGIITSDQKRAINQCAK